MKEADWESAALPSELHKSAEFKDISPFDRRIRGSLPPCQWTAEAQRSTFALRAGVLGG
jgi:hypothetical protein